VDLGWDVFFVLLKTEKILKPYIANIPSQKTMQTTACGHRLAHTYPTPLGTMIFRKLEQHLFMRHLVGNTFGNPFGLKTIAPTYTIDHLSKDVGAGLGSTGDPIQISKPPWRKNPKHANQRDPELIMGKSDGLSNANNYEIRNATQTPQPTKKTKKLSPDNHGSRNSTHPHTRKTNPKHHKPHGNPIHELNRKRKNISKTWVLS